MELISVLKKSTVLKSVSVNGCVKTSSDSEDEKKIVDLFLSLQDMTQNQLEFIAFKQNKVDLKHLPIELEKILVI